MFVRRRVIFPISTDVCTNIDERGEKNAPRATPPHTKKGPDAGDVGALGEKQKTGGSSW